MATSTTKLSPRRLASRTRIDLGPLVTAEDYDWADQRGARAARSADDAPESPSIGTGPRLDRLIVNRESDEYDKALLDGSIRQSWERNSDAPHIDTIRDAGLDPLYQPKRCPFPVVTLSGERFRAAFFVLGNVGWVYSAASAKSANSRGDNEFTAMLCQLITQYRPVEVDAVAFTRLVRSLDYGPLLGSVCARFTDRVRAGEETLDFKDHPEWAQLLWVFLSTMAAAERDEIQRRHTAGVLVKHSKGQWLQEKHVPFGYVYLQSTQQIVPDPSCREAVQGMLRILVSDLPAATKVDQLIVLGVVPGRPANARSLLRRLVRWIPLYVSGIWIQHYANPLRGVTEWMGQRVVRNNPEDLGYFELPYQPGVPPGGWAEEPLRRAAMATVREAQRGRKGGKRSRRGLAGYRWDGPIGARAAVLQWRISTRHGLYVTRVRCTPGS